MPPPHSTLLFLLLLLFFLLLFIYSFSSKNIPHHISQITPPPSSSLFLSLSPSSNSTISAHLRALTTGPHVAGTASSSAAAAYVVSSLRSSGIETLTREYSPLLSYPSFSSLSLLTPNFSLLKTLSLLEPADTRRDGITPPYHAYSPSGSFIAGAVFANYGTDSDYAALEKLGVVVSGRIVIIRGGIGSRGAVVAKAAGRGAKAVVMYGERSDGGVERGTAMSGSLGDPLTPGWAAVSAGSGERLREDDEDVKKRMPRIPSMPVAAETAAEILRALDGPVLPKAWKNGLATVASGVGEGNVLVNFTYQEDRRRSTIQNVFGVIKGREEPDRYVILGNHRDAWTYGAVDPNSGTSAFLDIAHRYGVLLRSGWRPRRTIVLCSWDAEEFGMIGSTEWVEQNIGILGSSAVVYLNVDCAVQGPGFFASATPQLDNLLINITKQVNDPDVEGRTVYQTWHAENGRVSIERLARADSDFSAFLHHAGVPSVDLYYGKEFPGYHTALDTYEWMEKHGDPLFHRHVAMSEVWGLLGLHLADDSILPFDHLSYAKQLQDHANALQAFLDGGISLEPIIASITEFADAAYDAQEEAKQLREQETNGDSVELRLRSYNDRILLVERSFLEAEGLTGRPWFKHLLYSPPEDYESKISFFPGIADAISRSRKVGRREEQEMIQHEIWKIARAIQRAAATLSGELI